VSDPKPYTLDELQYFWVADDGHTAVGATRLDRLRATAQAAAEADSLRAQLEAMKTFVNDDEEFNEEDCPFCERSGGGIVPCGFHVALGVSVDCSGREAERAHAAEAALTTAQGEVARLTGELEGARKDLAAGVRGLQDLASMVGPREAGWSDVWSSVELLKRERDASQGQVAVLREALDGLLSKVNEGEVYNTGLDAVFAARAALASTRATADAHDERVRREALDEAVAAVFKERELLTEGGELDGMTIAANVVRALAHPTEGPK
jgi:hypothetical protein